MLFTVNDVPETQCIHYLLTCILYVDHVEFQNFTDENKLINLLSSLVSLLSNCNVLNKWKHVPYEGLSNCYQIGTKVDENVEESSDL